MDVSRLTGILNNFAMVAFKADIDGGGSLVFEEKAVEGREGQDGGGEGVYAHNPTVRPRGGGDGHNLAADVPTLDSPTGGHRDRSRFGNPC